MGLRSEVDNRSGRMLRQQLIDHRRVADIGLHEDMAGVVPYASEIVQVSRIGQLVDVDNGVIFSKSQSRRKMLPMKPAPPVTMIVMLSRF